MTLLIVNDINALDSIMLKVRAEPIKTLNIRRRRPRDEDDDDGGASLLRSYKLIYIVAKKKAEKARREETSRAKPTKTYGQERQ